MAFTPTNLAVASLGSCQLTIATIANGASGTDLWVSGIPDIQGVVPVYTGSLTDIASRTEVAFAVSFTQSTGTIHILRGLSASRTAFALYVLSGFASDMTW